MESLENNLDDYFSLDQSHNSEGMVDVMPVDTPAKSEEARSKNNPNGSSHQRVDKLSEPLLEPKQPAQDSEASSTQNINKSAQGSVKEGPS